MSALNAVRLASFLDGLSYLVLVGLAMPKKYLGGDPSWVSAIGPVHGGFFVALCLALLVALLRYRWPLHVPARIFLAALVPVLPLFLDRWIRTRPTTETGAGEQGPRITS